MNGFENKTPKWKTAKICMPHNGSQENQHSYIDKLGHMFQQIYTFFSLPLRGHISDSF